jgi:teichoic acid transport system ATP-binding protein
MAAPERLVMGTSRSTQPLALVCRDLHVSYRVYQQSRPGLRAFVRSGFRGRTFSEVHAVRGVDLDIGHGETVGIIGPNGSGKSTLLRSLAGVLPATRGQVHASSYPTLLGVNAALRGTLSGRKNIEVGLLALGVSRSKLPGYVDEVVDFAEVGDAIDRPLRTYSSGMRARLHFGIATAIRPEILFVDEALAVGDKRFRSKSLQRISEMREGAGTIVIVSHNLNEIRRASSRVIWLEAGKVVMDGEPSEVLGQYGE